MEVFMQRAAFNLFLFACFAITVAKQLSYYPTVFPASQCLPDTSSDVLISRGFDEKIEEKIAGFDLSVIENTRSVLYCFKIPPDHNNNRSVCLCNLYHLENTLLAEKYLDNILVESSVETGSSLPPTNDYFSRLGTVIWIFVYIYILYYAYHTIMKYRSDCLISTSRQNSSSSSSDEWSELDLGEGLGTLHALPILPSNFNPSPSNMELEIRAQNEYVFIRRPFLRPKVEKWLKDLSLFASNSNDNIFDSRKCRSKEEKSSVYDPQCGYSGFLINHQRSAIFREGIPGYNDDKPSRYWASMHNIGEHIDTVSKAWYRSLPNICPKWSFNNKVGYSLLPDPFIEKQEHVFEWQSDRSRFEIGNDNLDSVSVACLRRFYQRHLRREKAKANGIALSSNTSSESCDSSEQTSCAPNSTCLSLSSLSNISTVLNMATTSEETTQSSHSLHKSEHPPPHQHGMWRLYKYPIPPSITSSSPHHEQELQANKEYIFIQRPYPIPLVHNWLQNNTRVLSNENTTEDTCGYPSYLIKNDKTEMIVQGVPGYRDKVKSKCWSSMHQIGEHKRNLHGVHGSLPNIFHELGFKHEATFNERTFKSFVVKRKESCPDEVQSNPQVYYEDNLESISVACYRKIKIDQAIDEARRQAARAKVENAARQLALRQQKRRIISEFLLGEIKREFHEQVVVPLVLNTSKMIVIEILRLF